MNRFDDGRLTEILAAEASEHPDSQPLVPWWSFSKTILAAAVLVLVDRGTLDLDAQLTDASYTLRHLLQHTSGLPDYGGNREYQRAVAAGESPWPIEELLGRVKPSSPLLPAGTRFLYSNIGYLFVRQIIERATNVDLEESLRTLVLDPLGI
ncbi:MAG: serine hydrolase domain-containing protein, partial [Vicinamibacterales bacterium]